MLFDQVTIVVRGGSGGNGCVSFRREKYVPFGGPNGGNGGRGGNVYLRVNTQLNTLVPFTRRRHFVASDGGHGMGKGMRGTAGDDLYVDVPPGTVVRNHETQEVLGDLHKVGQTLLVAPGGRGGRGNETFKTPTHQAPRFAEKGEPGAELTLGLELKLIADVGLLGKPNAGKSTLLASVSAARPKIADYPFTTLSPNLGVVETDDITFVMADIPGLIEGAHAGAGLGLQFLRHVERTRLLVHLLDGTSLDPIEDYLAINRELALHSEKLAAKPQIVVLNKIDVTEVRELLPDLREALPPEAGEVLAISAATHDGVRHLLRAIVRRLAELPVEEPDPEMYVFRMPEREDDTYTITKIAHDTYRVEGQEIERLAVMTDWNSDESLERFERILGSRGISAALEEAGVELGDTVFIGDFELVWD